MNDFSLIEFYNHHYLSELKNALETVMPSLIEAFINVYGTSHASYIRDTLNNITYAFIISPSYFETFIKFKDALPNHEYLVDYYYRYIKKTQKEATTIPDEFERELYLANAFLIADTFDENYLYSGKIISLAANGCALYCNETNEDFTQTYKVVFLPIITINFDILIHELNHVFGNKLTIFHEERTFQELSMFESLITENNDCIISEELINDYIAQIVKKEYLKLGGSLPKALNTFKIINPYQENSFLVEYFFQELGTLFLKSYISGNYSLMNLVGSANFTKFCQIITSLYNSPELYSEDFNPLINIINLMKMKYDLVDPKTTKIL